MTFTRINLNIRYKWTYSKVLKGNLFLYSSELNAYTHIEKTD